MAICTLVLKASTWKLLTPYLFTVHWLKRVTEHITFRGCGSTWKEEN